jgi:spore germination protein
LLYNTPLEIRIFSLLLVSAIAVNYGLINIARLCSNYSVITILSLIIILALSLKYFNFETIEYNLFTISFLKIFQAAFKLTPSFLGFAIILFAAPFLSKPEKMVKVSVISTLLVALIYTITVMISFGEFQLTPNQYIMYPTGTLSKAVFIPGFAERIDLLFMTFWILAGYITITVRWFTLSYSLSKIVPQKNYTVFTFLSLPLIYMLSLIIQSDGEVEKLSGFLAYTSWFVFIPIVFILLILSFIRKSPKTGHITTPKLGQKED